MKLIAWASNGGLFEEGAYRHLNRVLKLKENQHLDPKKVIEIFEGTEAMHFFKITANFGKLENDAAIAYMIKKIGDGKNDDLLPDDRLAAYNVNPQLCDAFFKRELENECVRFDDQGNCTFIGAHEYENWLTKDDCDHKTDRYKEAAYSLLFDEILDTISAHLDVERLILAVYTLNPDGSRTYVCDKHPAAVPYGEVEKLAGGIHDEDYYFPDGPEF